MIASLNLSFCNNNNNNNNNNSSSTSSNSSSSNSSSSSSGCSSSSSSSIVAAAAVIAAVVVLVVIIMIIIKIDKARHLAHKAAHSSDCLFARPISSCGLCMCDETIRVAVRLCLGLNLCEAHTTLVLGASVSARHIHGLSCKKSAERSVRHQQINDLIWRTLKRSDVPVTKEPTGLLRNDRKRSDGLMFVP